MAKRARKSSGRMASKGFPNPIDVHVGNRIRLRRTLLGISQTTLAEGLGLTFQQVQKYERGANRVSSSRLFDTARVLDVPLSYFFDEMAAGLQEQTPSKLMISKKLPKVDHEPDPLARRETLELVRAYYKIEDLAVRKRVFELTKAVAKAIDYRLIAAALAANLIHLIAGLVGRLFDCLADALSTSLPAPSTVLQASRGVPKSNGFLRFDPGAYTQETPASCP